MIKYYMGTDTSDADIKCIYVVRIYNGVLETINSRKCRPEEFDELVDQVAMYYGIKNVNILDFTNG